jgi:hypothetical protein
MLLNASGDFIRGFDGPRLKECEIQRAVVPIRMGELCLWNLLLGPNSPRTVSKTILRFSHRAGRQTIREREVPFTFLARPRREKPRPMRFFCWSR